MSSKYHHSRYDPLEYLRNFTIEGRKITYQSNHICFQKDVKFPADLPTAWISPSSKKQYTIGSLWVFLEFRDKSMSEYISKLGAYNCQGIVVSDRDQIKNYFTGKINTTVYIDEQVRLQLGTKNVLAKQKNQLGIQKIKQQGSDMKGQIDPMSVIQYIGKYQRPVSSKTRSLRCPHKSFQKLLKIIEQMATVTTQVQQQKKLRINRIIDKKKCPIIIVPEIGIAGNLSIGNIQRFLTKGQYTQTFYTSNIHQRKLQFFYQLKGRKVIFQVTNNPSLIPNSDWDNVVAIFVQGKKKQFSNWPISDPSQLFRKYKGFLVKYPSKQYTQANNWNVKVLTLDKTVRLKNEEIKNIIWHQIQDFLTQRI